jgi:hypothetical protein
MLEGFFEHLEADVFSPGKRLLRTMKMDVVDALVEVSGGRGGVAQTPFPQ